MKKGYTISTILKLLAGMIALAIVVYLIYRYVVHSPLSKQECSARMVAWCTQCQIEGFKGGGNEMGDELSECANHHWSWGVNSNQQCTSDMQGKCKGFIPIGD